MRVDLLQGSEPWHDWRSGGIGGSDAASVMDCSLYTTREDLALYKTGKKVPPQFPEFLAKKGHAKEIVGRAFAQDMMGVPFEPHCYQSDDHDFIRASLDGICPDELMTLECKFVGAKAFEELQRTKIIPDHHFWQIVQGFLTCPTVLHGYYVVINDSDKCYGVMIERKQSDCDRLTKKLVEYWAHIQSGEVPDAAPEFVDLSDNNEFTAAIADYLSAGAEMKALKAKQGEALALVKEFSNGVSASCSAGHIKYFEKKGSVDYKKLLKAFELDSIDVEPYRGKTSTSYGIKGG